jgi:surface antigen
MTITFDDLPSAVKETKWIPDKYKGFNWSKIVYMERSYATETYPESGYVTAFNPDGSSHIAFFNEEATVSVKESNETFTLVSLAACTAWNDNLHLTIIGYRNSKQVNTHTSTLLFGKPQVIVLLWKNIDEITLQPSGGTAHSENSELESDTHCVLTQLTIDY